MTIAEIFAPDGVLSRSIDGFHARVQQTEMAEQIAAGIAEQAICVIEAGTGTGKTFAYLVPALLSGGRVVISTGTKNLQDQLFCRDLPRVVAALGGDHQLALLKGRANYVCWYHLERHLGSGRFARPQDGQQLLQIKRYARQSETGDISHCEEVPESSPVWPLALSSRDNCLGHECPNYDECFVNRARKKALDADVIVVNHHLFFADVMLRDEGLGELLPQTNVVIFDEAHQLPETASLFFGQSIALGQLLELARDTRDETITSARDCVALIDVTHALEKAARDVRIACGFDSGRYAWQLMQQQTEFNQACQDLQQQLENFNAVLASQAERSEGLANCAERGTSFLTGFKDWQVGLDGDFVRWLEVFSQSLIFHATPMDIAPIFRRQLAEAAPKSWVFASATLAVGNDFSHYLGELGLIGEGVDDSKLRTAIFGSPFDYKRQAVLFAPPDLPDPNSADFNERLSAMAWPLIEAAGGRCFVLCTSLRAMRMIHERLLILREQSGSNLPILLQGEASRHELLSRFRELGNAVLVASQSFWEGVDVSGDALSLVIIDKLPFAPPDDPVLMARTDQMKARGQNPFMQYQLPKAVMSMKQGAGRLIRSETDQGALVICDPRMLSKPYGRLVWQSLPPMRRTRNMEDILGFLKALPTASNNQLADESVTPMFNE